MFQTPNEIQQVDERCGLIFPWFTDNFLKEFVRLPDFIGTPFKDWDVFEWGGGCSTIWFAKKCKSVVTLESNQEWACKIVDYCSANSISNVQLDCIPVPPSAHHTQEHPNMLKYIEHIRKFPQKSFDCIVIDGSYRYDALLHSKIYLKSGGIIIYDNWLQDTSGYTEFPKNGEVIELMFGQPMVYEHSTRPYWKTAYWMLNECGICGEMGNARDKYRLGKLTCEKCLDSIKGKS